ncbi:YcgJ family protein [Pseudomonas sp. PDM25]|uniref:YcgJ family protein n=1 Tax=Pseudomonas sp. PDM25 TaxID=2854772 RepID=UPI001C47FCAB|nr:YcgJ family protein [Pseudomonas sp. PDM25]MBV7515700.1 YcgJ family protein [Pseudomonas sp. PDM25]
MKTFLISFVSITLVALAGSTLVFADTTRVFSQAVIFSPTPGVVCDRKSSFCVDAKGISPALTEAYLDFTAIVTLANKMGDGTDLNKESYFFSNGIYCSSREKQCYAGRLNPQKSRREVAELSFNIFGGVP